MNYYTEQAIDELEGLVAGWRRSDARVIVLCGGVSGKFITHFSAEEILDGVRAPETFIDKGPIRNERLNRILRGMSELNQPVIAALNGDAMGFGFELALACDLRVGQIGDHRYGLCETSLGIIPGGGGTQRLARVVGLGTALDLVLRARVLKPEEALDYGLLSTCAEDALGAAQNIAREICGKPRHGVAMAKRALHRGYNLSLADALTVETDASFRARLTDSARDALEEYVALPFPERRDWLEHVHEPRLD
ncbi:enoyl-CoA hydratase [Intrasporangium chromatireducens Q5-1]|uniref:Enoyl-CoA hydratase n=2 Tax=Intrasporangium TaxID=53357 RepID=W9GD10_9MICO|nr:enoyl-CoA hydratase [Intrasporangium chromatireducens Q5-1]